MINNVSQIKADVEDELNPILELLDERQYCLLGLKQRTNHSELETDAIALDLALSLLCKRMTQYAQEAETRSMTATSKREFFDILSGYSFQVSVNKYKGYNLAVHTEKQTQLLHHEGLKLTAVIATICALFYHKIDADPSDTLGILSFKPA